MNYSLHGETTQVATQDNMQVTEQADPKTAPRYMKYIPIWA